MCLTLQSVIKMALYRTTDVERANCAGTERNHSTVPVSYESQ